MRLKYRHYKIHLTEMESMQQYETSFYDSL
jgi:hypothetical protein